MTTSPSVCDPGADRERLCFELMKATAGKPSRLVDDAPPPRKKRKRKGPPPLESFFQTCERASEENQRAAAEHALRDVSSATRVAPGKHRDHPEANSVPLLSDMDLGFIQAFRRNRKGITTPRTLDAEDFLRNFLANGPVPWEDLRVAANDLGITDALLYKARSRVRITSHKTKGRRIVKLQRHIRRAVSNQHT